MSRSRAMRLRSFFSLLKEAISEKEQDYTRGSINRAIFLLAVPMVLEMVMESLFAVVDIFFVAKLGKEAVSTVGLTESVITIVYCIGIGLSMAATAIIARRVGEKKPSAASHTAIQAIYIGVFLSVIIAILGVIFAKEILYMMGASKQLVEEHHVYTRILMGSNIFIMLLFLINGIFRGAGNPSIAMRSLWIANGLNIILCPTLINGLGPIPAMGLTGAAVATTLGRGTGVVYQVYHLYNGKGVIKILRRHSVVNFNIIKNIIKVAAGGTAQFLINSASWIFLFRIMAKFGEEAMAGYTIAIRVIIFTILPAFGVANAAATLVGQNLGADQPDRAERSVWRAGLYNMIFLGTVSVIFFVFAGPIIRIFTPEPEVIHYGILCLRYVCLGYIFYAYGMVLIQSFNGAGDTVTPTVLNIFGFWLFQIPLAYVLAITLDYGPTGVFLAIAAAESLIAVIAMILFKRGKWKTVKV